jgi:hypothetical protein
MRTEKQLPIRAVSGPLVAAEQAVAIVRPVAAATGIKMSMNGHAYITCDPLAAFLYRPHRDYNGPQIENLQLFILRYPKGAVNQPVPSDDRNQPFKQPPVF